jgi:phosphatidylinositol alpha-1,6-mannosyltransferase
MSTGILLVTRNYPPLLGGMERLIHHVYLELKNDFEISVLGPRGCEDFVDPNTETSSCRLTPTPLFLACLQWKAYRMARRLKPSLIIAGSGMAAPAALCAARNLGVPVVCYLHGLDLVAKNPVYRGVFIPAIRRCNRIIANSQNTAALAREVGVNPVAIDVMHPGVTIPALDNPAKAPSSFRTKLKLQHKVILLSVGRIQPRKGLAEFVEFVLPSLVAKELDVVLVIIGSEPKNALKSSRGETQRILAAARSAGVEQHILMQGAVDDATLIQAYRESDLLVFPVRDIPGDVEGFGMVAVEAAAHGLPTVAFAAGGVPDAVKDGVSGYLVRPGDYAGFAEAIVRHVSGGSVQLRSRCIEYARQFSWEKFGEKLRNFCQSVIDVS